MILDTSTRLPKQDNLSFHFSIAHIIRCFILAPQTDAETFSSIKSEKQRCQWCVRREGIVSIHHTIILNISSRYAYVDMPMSICLCRYAYVDMSMSICLCRVVDQVNSLCHFSYPVIGSLPQTQAIRSIDLVEIKLWGISEPMHRFNGCVMYVDVLLWVYITCMYTCTVYVFKFYARQITPEILDYSCKCLWYLQCHLSWQLTSCNWNQLVCSDCISFA